MAAGPSSTAPLVDRTVSGGLANIPLFHAAWLFAVGILLASALWIQPTVALVAFVLSAALCVVAATFARRLRWIVLGILWIILGLWCAEVEPHPAPAAALATLSDGLLRTVEGVVVQAGPVHRELEVDLDEPSVNAPAQSLDIRVANIEQVTDDADRQVAADGTIRLTVRWPAGGAPAFRCGDRVRADARLLLPTAYHDAGAWSRADYLLDQGVTSSATVSADRIQRVSPSSKPNFSCRLAALQHSATDRLLSLPSASARLPAPLRLSVDDAVMMAAMVAGDRTYLSHSMRAGFERTGSFHMLVVSGLHLAIVAGFLFWLARRTRIPRVPATLLTIAASFAYALFTGFATPVQRSFWMVALYLLGRLFYRDRSPLNAIGFSTLCLLALSPRSLFDASFQMTLLAVVSIAGFPVPVLAATIHPYAKAARDLRLIAIDVKLNPRLAAFRVFLRMIALRLRVLISPFVAWRAFPWALRFVIRIAELVVVSIVVELAMTLPMAINFHRITLVALPVNLLILPLLTFLVPAALLTVIALFIWTPLAVIPASIVAIVLHASVRLVHFFGSLELGDIRIASPLPVQIALFWILLAAAIALASHYSSRQWIRRAACLALLLAACAAVVPHPIDRPRDAMLVEAIDVGQGDSLLLITPDGKTLLIDAGGFGGGPRQATQDFDIGEEVVSAALWSRGIHHLDAVALSHAHSDHMGGMPAIIRNFHPQELWVGDNPPVAPYNELLAEAANLKTRVRTFHAGDAFAFGDTQVEILAPARDYQPDKEPANNDSLVLHVFYRETSVLFEGDSEAQIEQAMLSAPNLQSTLLKVGHHGSTTSTTPAFLARVAPQWAVVSAGPHNRYGHPRPEILAELEQAHARTYRTDIDGATCFVLDGKSGASDDGCGWRP